MRFFIIGITFLSFTLFVGDIFCQEPQTTGVPAVPELLDAKRLLKTLTRESYERSREMYHQLAKSTMGQPLSADYMREAAKISLILGDVMSANADLDVASNLDDAGPNVEGHIKTLSLMLLVKIRSGDVNFGKKLVGELTDLHAKTGDPAALAYADFSRGEFSGLHGNIDETITLLSDSVRSADDAADMELYPQALLKLGYARLRKGEPVLALDNIGQALEKWTELDDRRGMARAFFGMGFVHGITNGKQAAMEAFSQAEQLFPVDFDEVEKGRLFNAIATVQEEYGENVIALTYRLNALGMYRKAGYRSGVLATLPSLGELYYMNGDRNASLKSFAEARKLARILQQDFYLGVTIELEGDIDLVEGKYYAARDKSPKPPNN